MRRAATEHPPRSRTETEPTRAHGGQDAGLVEPAQHEPGAPQEVIVPAADGLKSSGHEAFEELLTLAEPDEGLARTAEQPTGRLKPRTTW
jgi:hypothetical protein